MPPVRSFETELQDWETKLPKEIEPGKFVVVTSDGVRMFDNKAAMMKALQEEGLGETVH